MNIQQDISLNIAEWIALILVTVGALNWGLVGISGFTGGNLNMVHILLGGIPTLESLIYLLVGLAGVYFVYMGVQIYGARSGELIEPAEPH